MNLLDTKTGDLVNMITSSSYGFTGKSSRSFKIFKGSYAYISEQTGRIVGGFRLFPNPTSEYLHVETYAKVNAGDIKIYTIDGKELTPTTKEIVKNDDLSQVTRIGIDNIGRGTYLVRIGDNAKVFVIN